MPALPAPVTGAFVSMFKGRMIAAGGIRALPESGKLADAEFLDTVYVLTFTPEGVPQTWQLADTRLPVPAAFGPSVDTGGELLLIGGMTADGPTDVIQAVTLTDSTITAATAGIPRLPKPLAFTGAVKLNRDFNKVYSDRVLVVIGGLTHNAAGTGWQVNDTPLAYTLSVDPAGCHKLLKVIQAFFMRFWARPEAPGKWMNLSAAYGDYFPPQPLPENFSLALVEPLLVVRKDFRTEKASLFVFGGLHMGADGVFTPSRGVAYYVPGNKSLDGWWRMPDMPANHIPLSAFGLGAAHVVVWGATPEGVLDSPDSIVRQQASHMKLFHSVTATWVDLPTAGRIPVGGAIVELPKNPMITYPHGRFAWLGTDAVQGLNESRTALITVHAGALRDAHIHFSQRFFTGWDILVIVIYLGGMLYIGNYFSKREHDTDDFFLGGRKIPWWAAGISIYATGISAISFMAIPAKTFATNWDRICLGLFPPITTFIAAYLFVPLLRNLRITTMMEYMEMRFNRAVRYISSFLMILSQIGGRMAVTLLLPSIALSAVTGIDVKLCILLMGILATVYTVMGGISAVIWTDVAQTVVIFGGALLALIVICFHVDGGAAGVFREAINPEFEKLKMFNWSFDLTVATVWVFTLWGIGDLFGRIGQESLQRAFSTPDEKSAKRSMVTCAVISIPGTILFYLLGTALFAYYRTHAFELDPAMEENAILPFFVVQKLPPGVSGLIIAGLFAAAMSTLDSGMNSVATVLVRDYYAVFRKDSPEKERLTVARWITCIAGALGTAMALYFATGRGLGNAWDLFSKIMALIGGGFGGVIVLAMLTKRASTAATLIGVAVGTLTTVMLEVKAFNYAFIFFVYGTLSTAVSVTVGYLMSFIFPNKKDLTGLTVWTKRSSK